MGWYGDKIEKLKNLPNPYALLYVTAKVLGGVGIGVLIATFLANDWTLLKSIILDDPPDGHEHHFDAVIHYDHYKKAQDLAVAALRDGGTLPAGDFKKAIGATRKYAIALLDYLDAQRITIRIGNDRKLAKDFEKHLL